MKEAVSYKTLLCFLFFFFFFSFKKVCIFGCAASSLLSGGSSLGACAGLSLQGLLFLGSPAGSGGARKLSSHGSQALEHRLSIAVAHGLSCSVVCGIFPDQGLNPCLLHWQADALPRSHEGSPSRALLHEVLASLY